MSFKRRVGCSTVLYVWDQEELLACHGDGRLLEVVVDEMEGDLVGWRHGKV